jgi:hypothetical protein
MSVELKAPKATKPNKIIIVAMGKTELTSKAFLLLTAPIDAQLMQMPITKHVTEMTKFFSVKLSSTCPMLTTVGMNFKVP